MITKKYSMDKRKCRVTFSLPAEVESRSAHLCGEFTDWVGEEMTRRKDGSFSLSMTLPAGRQYQFRYLLASRRWENDPQADALVPNPFGSEDSLLQL